MLQVVFETILAMSAAGGILLLLIFILRPVTIRVFSAAWNYYMSLIVIVFLLVPIGFVIGRISSQFMDVSYISVVPQMGISEVFFVSLNGMPGGLTEAVMQQPDQSAGQAFLVDGIVHSLPYIWLLGMVIFIAHKTIQLLKFKRKLLQTSLPVEQESHIYEIFQSCKANMGIRQKIMLLSNDSIKTPMVTGLLKTHLIVPEVEMDKRELKYIFYHELTHCKRRDLWFKAVALFTNALHWFNPLVYRMVYHINDLCEISCDEAVVRDMSMEERHFYGETILNVLSRVVSKQEGFCSTLCENQKGIKRRLTFIMKKKNFSQKKATISIGIIIVMCMMGTAFAYIFSPSVEHNINADTEEMEDWNWKNSLDEMNEEALFADIVSGNTMGEEKTDQFKLTADQFFAAISQYQKTMTEEKEIERLTVPVPGGKITSPYGNRIHPITKEHKLHTGIDYARPQGSDIVAANDGRVIAAQKVWKGMAYYGKYVIIAHRDGTVSLYGHCSDLMVNTGDSVKKGDKIAEIGSTGASTGPHCHFEFRVNGKPVNPMDYIDI